MTPDWLADWSGRIRSIGENLLTIEINTVEKPAMSAEKMPDVPLALHAIIDTYGVYLARQGYMVDARLYDLAQQRMALPLGTDPALEKGKVTALASWRPATLTGEPPEMTNGPEAFEALQWAADAMLRDMADIRDGAVVPRGAAMFDPETIGVLQRIRSNSRQLREAVILLKRDHPEDSKRERLFGVTVEAAVRALLNNPLPPLFVRPDVIILIRKAWDIGTEIVLMQTTMQIDGDVVVRVSPALDAAKRDFVATLHAECVRTGLGQWQSLFGMVRDLAGSLGQAIWGVAH